jgi:hypothetical protein
LEVVLTRVDCNLIIKFNNDIRHIITKTLKNEIHCSLKVHTDYSTTLSITRANIVRAKQSWVIASSVLANPVKVQVRVRTSTCT